MYFILHRIIIPVLFISYKFNFVSQWKNIADLFCNLNNHIKCVFIYFTFLDNLASINVYDFKCLLT